MIVAELKDKVLTVRGHAGSDSRVCAAVSMLTGVLYTSYDAEQPEPGSFSWNSESEPEPRARELVFNCFRLLAMQYPGELVFQE